MKLVVCDHVSKYFHRHSGGQRLLREHVSSWWKRRPQTEFYAVKDVSFEIADGESVEMWARFDAEGYLWLDFVIVGTTQPKVSYPVGGERSAVQRIEPILFA